MDSVQKQQESHSEIEGNPTVTQICIQENICSLVKHFFPTKVKLSPPRPLRHLGRAISALKGGEL
jgi:hypothetical protein